MIPAFRFSFIFCLLAGLVLSCPVQAQDIPPDVDLKELYEKAQAALGSNQGTDTDAKNLLPEIPCELIEEPQVLESCHKALISYYDYFQFGMEHRKRVFFWQHIHSRIIFVTVLSLVFAGVFFAWKQFSASLNQIGDTRLETSSVELGTKGIKISSPVLGVIILSISMGFFYLYLVFVYPIVEII